MSDSLNKLDNNFLKEFKFTLKEHSLRKMNHLLKFEFKTSNLSIQNLRQQHKYAIVSNTTSAAVDLYLLGFNLIIIVDQNSINLSPLKDDKNVIFLYNHNLLSHYLKKIRKENNLDKKKTNFFYYNEDYNLWNDLINSK